MGDVGSPSILLLPVDSPSHNCIVVDIDRLSGNNTLSFLFCLSSFYLARRCVLSIFNHNLTYFLSCP